MTTSTDYPFRSGQLRRAGVLMRLPRVVIAAVVWLLVIEALPGPRRGASWRSSSSARSRGSSPNL